MYTIHNTNEIYSPHDQLPTPEPRNEDPPLGLFYHNTAKHLIKDTVRVQMNGLSIDLDRVEALEKVLDEQLVKVTNDLANNPLINKFQHLQHKQLVKDYIADRKSKMRTVDHYIKPFDPSNMVHRSYFMHLYAQQYDIPLPTTIIEGTSITKWPANLVKTFAKTRPILQRLLDKTLTTHELIDKAMNLLAQDKCNIYNQKYLEAIQSPDVPVPAFNPASPLQKQKLFAWLGIESDKVSKDTGQPSFDRPNIERINKETTDEDIKALTQCFIDHSFAAIVRNNFIEAFYRYSILYPDGSWRLQGNLKLFGTKTFRLTSQNPNLLNMPSTKSAFAKPIKSCFKAKEGWLVAGIDYSALENRVIANLAKEETLIKMYQDDLDGHCVNSLYYFREEISQYMELTGDLAKDAKVYAELVDDGHKELTAIRQRGKNPSFGLQYGAYPPKIASSIKCSLEEAQQIFDRYHNELYPAVTKFREEYVLPTALANNKLHLGLGCYINTDNPERDIRTVTNSCSQFWSILTLLAINKIHQRIDEAGLSNDILVVSTIYDAIYFEVREDPKLIYWLNNNIIPIMKQPYLENEIVHNLCDLEIGPDWATLSKIDNDASLKDIETLMETIHDLH